eukprot:scaffold44191_cov20-Tisochrysis_lutea.AAC.3
MACKQQHTGVCKQRHACKLSGSGEPMGNQRHTDAHKQQHACKCSVCKRVCGQAAHTTCMQAFR